MLSTAGMDGVSVAFEGFALFLAPVLHESLAFVGGGYLVHTGRMSLLLCLALLLAGVVASDLAIYGLGRLARHNARIAAWLPVGTRSGTVLDRNLAWLIPVCRFVPGLLFTTFATCGLLGLNFRRFATITVLTAAVYTPALLYAVLRFGDAVAAPGQFWPWFAVLAGLFALTSACRWLVGQHMDRRPSCRASAES